MRKPFLSTLFGHRRSLWMALELANEDCERAESEVSTGETTGDGAMIFVQRATERG